MIYSFEIFVKSVIGSDYLRLDLDFVNRKCEINENRKKFKYG